MQSRLSKKFDRSTLTHPLAQMFPLRAQISEWGKHWIGCFRRLGLHIVFRCVVEFDPAGVWRVIELLVYCGCSVRRRARTFGHIILEIAGTTVVGLRDDAFLKVLRCGYNTADFGP